MKKLIPLILIFTLGACVQQKEASTPSGQVQEIKACEISDEAEALSHPQSIAELMSLLNALPKPLDLECFLKSLRRPLFINATSSMSSAQPALSAKDPRIFIFKGDLIISIVTSGKGSKLLEFSELLSDTRSIKGELEFPITNTLFNDAPFERIINNNRTSCSGCHGVEREEYQIDGTSVFSSKAVKPTVNSAVSVEELKYQEYLCDFYSSKDDRCQAYRALFMGEVKSQSFPGSMPTFLNSF